MIGSPMWRDDGDRARRLPSGGQLLRVANDVVVVVDTKLVGNAGVA